MNLMYHAASLNNSPSLPAFSEAYVDKPEVGNSRKSCSEHENAVLGTNVKNSGISV
jgi:hypothetical protein